MTEKREDGAIFPGNSGAVWVFGMPEKIDVLLEGGQWETILSGQPKVRTTNPDLQQWKWRPDAVRISEGW